MRNSILSLIAILVFSFGCYAAPAVVPAINSNLPLSLRIGRENTVPYPIPASEKEIGPSVPNYTFAGVPLSEEEELEGLQVPVPRSMRVLNTKGCCVWSSMQVAANYSGMTQLYGITKDVKDGGDRRCQGGSSPSPVRSFLEDEKIKFDMIENGDVKFLIKYCKEQRRPVCFDIPGHMLNLVHYDPDTKLIKIIDNADYSLSVQTWSWEKFHSKWQGWAYVIIGEPDNILYMYDTYQFIGVTYGDKDFVAPKGYFPLPK